MNDGLCRRRGRRAAAERQRTMVLGDYRQVNCRTNAATGTALTMTHNDPEDWLDRWQEGRIGWHEPGGNASLRAYWPALDAGARVLVPLCGKSHDLYWLAKQGARVTGVELSPLAVRAFFEEHGLAYRETVENGLHWCRSDNPAVEICCADYFDVVIPPCDALYDRGALVAMPAALRRRYVEHTQQLLKPEALRLVITLEYDQSRAAGPPYSVPADEVLGYWPDLECISVHNDLDNAPPKFREAGLTRFDERVWRSPQAFSPPVGP
ncbi:MAG: thiopurine S-methyltransferase [Woeseiaceae bacterium]|nr:thiopurine S-methyltransferase [Woeseiaceae bacterium]